MIRPRKLSIFFINSNLVIICLICGFLLKAGQVSEIHFSHNYTLDVWNVKKGMVQNSVVSLLQTRNGYIWMGTHMGLSRFDGLNFRVFNKWNTPQLKSDVVTFLFEDKSGSLWIGTENGGLVHYKDRIWSSYTVDNGLSNNTVTSITQDGESRLWIGTKYGLNKLENNKFTVYTTEDGLSGNSINSVFYSSSGDLLIGTDGDGACEFTKGSFIALTGFDDMLSATINEIVEDNEKIIWVGTDNGLFWLDGNKAQKFKTGKINLSGSIKVIKVDQNNRMWVGTDGDGLFCIVKGEAKKFVLEPVIFDNYIYALMIDYEGNIWGGTYTEGIFRLKNKRVQTISVEDGLPENIINAVLVDNKGFLWTASKKGLSRFSKKKLVMTYNSRNGLLDNDITAIHEDNGQNVWAGSKSGNIYKINNKGVISNIKLPADSEAKGINVIFSDRHQRIWIGSNKGLYCLFDNGLQAIRDQNLYKRNIQSLYQDSAGKLWIGTRKGILYMEEDQYHPVTDFGTGKEYVVTSFLEIKKNLILAGTKGDGICIIDNGKLKNHTTRNGLKDDYIFSTIFDDKENIWLSSRSGLIIISRNAISDFADGEVRNIRYRLLDDADGMTSRECTGTGKPSIFYRSGHIYVPTFRGVAIVNTAKIQINRLIPPVNIDNVIVDNISIVNQKKPVISDKKEVFEFYFSVLSFSDPKKNILKYKLEGFDRDWVTVSQSRNRNVLYVNLNPGQYVFRVIGCNNDGTWNETGASFAFIVKKGFLSTFTFKLLLLLLLFAGATVSVKMINQKKSKTLKGKKYSTSALLPERAEEAMTKLVKLMEDEKIYLDPELTLKILSEKLMIHYNYLSQIINEKFNQSSNDFINKYRIKEAQKMLLEKDNTKTILEIAYDTGFYSKSVFNAAFKKFTGKTPSQYRKKKK